MFTYFGPSRPAGERVWVRLLVLFAVAVGLSGCASFYVDPTLPQVKAEQIKRPAAPQSTQLLVDFQTNGVSNPRAVTEVLPMVQKAVQDSGLFAEVKTEPVASRALLTVTINNVGDMKDAAARGFATGLTLGLVGSTVTDGYVCTIRYEVPGASAFTTQVQHSLITTLGAASAPAGLKPAASAREAVEQIVNQMVLTGMQRLSVDPALPR